MAYGRRRRVRGPLIRQSDPREQERTRKRREALVRKYGEKGASDVMAGRAKWQRGAGGKYVPSASLEKEKATIGKGHAYRFKPVNLVMNKKYKSEIGSLPAQEGVHVHGKLLYRVALRNKLDIINSPNYVSFMKSQGVPLVNGRVKDLNYIVEFDKDGYPIVELNKKFYYQGKGNLEPWQRKMLKGHMAIPLPGVIEMDGTLHEAVNELAELLSEEA
jgi:hypothetical protein